MSLLSLYQKIYIFCILYMWLTTSKYMITAHSLIVSVWKMPCNFELSAADIVKIEQLKSQNNNISDIAKHMKRSPKLNLWNSIKIRQCESLRTVSTVWTVWTVREIVKTLVFATTRSSDNHDIQSSKMYNIAESIGHLYRKCTIERQIFFEVKNTWFGWMNC